MIEENYSSFMFSDCFVYNQHMGKNGTRECSFAYWTLCTARFLGEANVFDMEPS